jgi:Bacterial transglutaminase-like cysteine proteinase BTLCP
MEQHGVADLWSSPLATSRSGFGDCEDFAIAKYVALGEAGTAPDDLRLVIVRQGSREFHVVLAARLDRRWMILDIPGSDLIEDTATGYVPRFIIDHRGIRETRTPDRPVADAPTAEWPGAATTCGWSAGGRDVTRVPPSLFAVAHAIAAPAMPGPDGERFDIGQRFERLRRPHNPSAAQG